MIFNTRLRLNPPPPQVLSSMCIALLTRSHNTARFASWTATQIGSPPPFLSLYLYSSQVTSYGPVKAMILSSHLCNAVACSQYSPVVVFTQRFLRPSSFLLSPPVFFLRRIPGLRRHIILLQENYIIKFLVLAISCFNFSSTPNIGTYS